MRIKKHLVLLIFVLLALAGGHSVAGQRIAILTPDRVEISVRVGAGLSDALARQIKVVDPTIAESAYLSVSPATPFNLSASDARRIGQAIGSDLFVILRAATQRRSPLGRPDYFETFAPIFLFSSRTGRLVFWKLQRAESTTSDGSRKLFEESLTSLSAEIKLVAEKTVRSDLASNPAPDFEEPPADDVPAAKGFRPPIPFRRLKPEYTSLAAFYDVRATVDMTVYLDADGKVVHTELERAAGFGLDEAVEQNVRSMNWRPAERNGKPMAMKFLVRYNFKKPE